MRRGKALLSGALALAIPLAAPSTLQADVQSDVQADAQANAEAKVRWDRVDLAAERTNIEAFQFYDQRLQDVGWRLISANAPYCERTIPSIGLQLQDVQSYGGRDAPAIVRRALGLSGDFAVQTAAAGSPAALSSALGSNREVSALNGASLTQWEAVADAPWARLKQVHDRIDDLLTRDGRVTVTFADGASATIEPVLACAGRFELLSGSQRFVANSERVLLGIENEVWSYEDSAFAAGIAHETAHMVLDHTAWLDRNGRGRSNQRATEREADRLMPWLLVNAGYNPRGAIAFFEQYRPHSGSVLFIRGTHDKWRDRIAVVEAEIAQIEALLESGGAADWAVHFRREINPSAGR